MTATARAALVVITLTVGLLGLCGTSNAQENMPCSFWQPNGPWPAWCHYAHDGMHSGVAFGVIGAADAVGVNSELARYLMGTVALPVLQEVWDIGRFQLVEGHPGPDWENKAYDWATYQLPWTVYLAKRDLWYSAQGLSVVYAGFLQYRYHGWDSIRNGPVFHGYAIATAMAVFEAIEPLNETAHPLIPYVMGNLFLGTREVLQLSRGEGEWGDLLSGLLLPLPALMIEEVLRAN